MNGVQRPQAAQNTGRLSALPADLYPFVDGDLFSNVTESEATDAAFTRWGHGLSGPLHCYVDDYRFAVSWRNPPQALVRAAAAGIVVAPDFSAPEASPYIFVQYQQWRSETIARYWQAFGVQVIPSLCFTSIVPEYAIAPGQIVAVRGPAKHAQDLWHSVVPEIARTLRPRAVLQFGNQQCADLWPCPVIAKPLRSVRHG